ncbi:TPA: hypothetical protein ACXP5C_004814 [Klebsiella pneumoniae]|uniref:hypothetical protein n=1 Tax=Klebsiella variicola TaxID=244366 RepID=UPI0006653036|nr:hypothetical protein [Klebsiella variicola]
MSINILKKVERHITYVGFGSPYASTIDVSMTIDILSVVIVSKDEKLASISHSIKFDVDKNVYIEQVENFKFKDEGELTSEAEGFLVKFYGE